MRNALIAIAAFIAVAVTATADTAELLRQLKGTSVGGSTPIRTSCKTVVIDGTNYVQETWSRGNFTWTNLQAEKRIIGARITNSYEQQIAVVKAELETRLAELVSATNRAAIAEARAAKVKTFLEEKRDEAKLATTKAIYQAVIDKLNED